MSIRKSVDMGPKGIRQPGPNGSPGNEQDYRFTASDGSQPNRRFFSQTGTKWIRLWASWEVIQPVGWPTPPGDPAQGALANSALASLDGQIQVARSDGLNVIVVSWRFPGWANGSTDEWVVPSDLTVSSAWGRWIRWLYERYRPGGTLPGADIQVLELCNEPNVQMKPQTGMPAKVARMLHTGQAISADYSHSVHIAGPATADTTSTDGRTPYDVFVPAVLNELDRIGFRAHSKFIWTHHNYTDVEAYSDAMVRTVAGDITGRWSGYIEGHGPMVFVTEGGARLSSSRVGGSKATQQTMVHDNLQKLDSFADTGMAANYLFFDDAGVQGGYSGLCDVYNGTVRERPAYGNPGWSSRASAGRPRQFQANWQDLGWSYKDNPAILSMRPEMLEFFALGSGDDQCWHRWYYGGEWGGPASLGGSCLYGPAAISRADGIMNVFVVGGNRQMYHRSFHNGAWTPEWEPLGGECTSAPAVCSMRSGHLESFVRGSDGSTTFGRRWVSGSGWGGWYPLGGFATSSPAAISRADGYMDAFVVLHGTLYWHSYSNGAWRSSGWWSLDSPPGGCTYRPTACSWSSQRLDIMVRGADGRVWRRYWDSGAWSGWEPIDGPTVDSAPAAVSWHTPGRYDLIARRSTVMYRTWTG